MATRDKIEPQWVLVAGHLRHVCDFAHLAPPQRPPAMCPWCDRPVVLKLGSVKVHHYAHACNSSCPASRPETALHLNTKFHFYRQLQEAQTRQLFIEQECRHCQESTQRQVWLQEWDDVKVEHRLEATRPDIALLAQGQVIGALEILVTHAVDARKAGYFAQQAIAWLEIPAAPALYEAPTAWTAADPLPLLPDDVPYPPWLCAECTRREERERPAREREQRRQQQRLQRQQERAQKRAQYAREIEIHVAMMADIYFAGGKKYREVFYVKKHIKGNEWRKVWVENEKKTLLTIHPTNEQPRLNIALCHIKAFIAQRLETFRSQGHIVDEVAPWRKWEEGKKFYVRDFDRYPLRYAWDESTRQWRGRSDQAVSRSVSRRQSDRSLHRSGGRSAGNSADTIASFVAVAHHHPEAGERLKAVTSLCKFAPYQVGGELRRCLQDRDDEVRLAAARTLVGWGDCTAVPVLRALAATEEFSSRRSVLKGLVPFQDDPQVRSLCQKAVADENSDESTDETNTLRDKGYA